MPTNKTIGGVVGSVTGAVLLAGIPLGLYSSEDVALPDGVAIEDTTFVSQAELCQEAEIVYTVQVKTGKVVGQTSNRCPVGYMQKLDEIDGTLVYAVNKAVFDEIAAGYDITINAGAITTAKGSKAVAHEDEKKKSANNRIYDQIGAQTQRKAGKQSVGADTSAEDAEITRLQDTLIP